MCSAQPLSPLIEHFRFCLGWENGLEGLGQLQGLVEGGGGCLAV